MFYKGFIEVDTQEVEELFDRIEKAIREIQDCGFKLSELGIVKLKKMPGQNQDGHTGD